MSLRAKGILGDAFCLLQGSESWNRSTVLRGSLLSVQGAIFLVAGYQDPDNYWMAGYDYAGVLAGAPGWYIGRMLEGQFHCEIHSGGDRPESFQLITEYHGSSVTLLLYEGTELRLLITAPAGTAFPNGPVGLGVYNGVAEFQLFGYSCNMEVPHVCL